MLVFVTTVRMVNRPSLLGSSGQNEAVGILRCSCSPGFSASRLCSSSPPVIWQVFAGLLCLGCRDEWPPQGAPIQGHECGISPLAHPLPSDCLLCVPRRWRTPWETSSQATTRCWRHRSSPTSCRRASSLRSTSSRRRHRRLQQASR